MGTKELAAILKRPVSWQSAEGHVKTAPKYEKVFVRVEEGIALIKGEEVFVQSADYLIIS